MNEINNFLNGVKVEWKKLGEVCETQRGKGLKKSDKRENGIPVILYGELYTTYGDYINEVETYVDSKKAKSSVKISKNNILLPISSTTKEAKIGKASLFKMESALLGGDAFSLIPNNKIFPSYLMYYLNSNTFEKEKMKCVYGTTIMHLNVESFLNLLIPIPPLEIQEKIAKTLDKFTNYATELQTELQLRTKQYEYYRNLLLSKEFLENMCVKFDDKPCGGRLETKMLGEICEILDYKRKPITKSKRIAGKYPYYGANGIQDYVDDYIFDGTFILMGEDGSVMTKNFTPVLHWVENNKIWVNNHAHIFKEIKNKCNLRYVYFYLSIVNISDLVKGVPPKLNQGNLRNIKILIPPLQIQEKIVQILDKFSDISSNLEKGLPKEIDLRQKEYEFYRDRLLNFKKD